MIANHIWQSTLFAVFAGLLTLLLRRQHARARYVVWFIASIKFLVPVSLLVAVGSEIGWRALPPAPVPLVIAGDAISRPFDAPIVFATPVAEPVARTRPLMLIWICGAMVLAVARCAHYLRLRRVLRQATTLCLSSEVLVLVSPAAIEPGVYGLFRPALLLPQGLPDLLSPKQFAAILAHEMCHVRWRDNLTAAVHMLVETLFWFHPLVWWLGARLIEEREKACDEEVLSQGNEPANYAAGILSVCKFYTESPLACVSGITGADLKKRIAAIMTPRAIRKLGSMQKLLLACAAVATVAGPFSIGLLKPPVSLAQDQDVVKSSPLVFDIATVKPSDPAQQDSYFHLLPGGGVGTMNTPLKQIIAFAYDVRDSQISGPPWISNEKFDVVGKPERPEGPSDLHSLSEEKRKVVLDRLRERLRALLADRFGLAVHKEPKEAPIYALVVSKAGLKIQPVTEHSRTNMSTNRGKMIAQEVPMEMIAMSLSALVGRPVRNQTGVTGNFTFVLEWDPPPCRLRRLATTHPPNTDHPSSPRFKNNSASSWNQGGDQWT